MKRTLATIAFLLVLGLMLSGSSNAAVGSKRLTFPWPEEITENTGGDHYQMGKTIFRTYCEPDGFDEKDVEFYLKENYPTWTEFEVYKTVAVGEYVAQCAKCTFDFEGDNYYALGVAVDAEECDYVLVMDISANEPTFEEIDKMLDALTIE